MFNEIFKEIDPSLSSSKVYYFKELNCEPTKTEFKFKKFIDNFNHISVYIIQQLTTDIRGVKIEKQ
tara:strand:+ start:809 stop:1006 length:198 start_codon:yes stop_codon:yes gene_type:complete